MATGQNPASYSYTCDKGGNLLSKNSSGVLTRYGYNSLDQIVWEHTAGEGQKSYEFDIYGNLTVEKLAGVTKRTYSWDGENRMTKAVLSENGKTYEFLYDADGARVKREVSGGSSQVVKTNYLSDYVNPSGYTQALQETDEAGEGRAYVWSGEGLLAQSGISPEPAEETRFSHTDHLGSVKALTGAAGATVAGSAFKYSPFGEKTAGANSTTSYRFTGQYAEDELGLQYHRARWLSPTKAGWMSQDPVYDFPANFGNGYGYVGQNPVNKMDFNGQFSFGDVGMVSSIQSSLSVMRITLQLNVGKAVGKAVLGVALNAISFYIMEQQLPKLQEELTEFADLIWNISPKLSEEANKIAIELNGAFMFGLIALLASPITIHFKAFSSNLMVLRSAAFYLAVKRSQSIVVEYFNTYKQLGLPGQLEMKSKLALMKDIAFLQIRPGEDMELVNNSLTLYKVGRDAEALSQIMQFKDRLKQYGHINLDRSEHQQLEDLESFAKELQNEI